MKNEYDNVICKLKIIYDTAHTGPVKTGANKITNTTATTQIRPLYWSRSPLN